MPNPNDILSDLTHFSKYAKYIPDLHRRETFRETHSRVRDMLKGDFPYLADHIDGVFETQVFTKQLLSSMRFAQFAGPAIHANNARGYNCAFHHIDSIESFSETMFLLLAGCGVGYSVQFHHVAKLPTVKGVGPNQIYQIADTIEGWADSIKVLLEAYLLGTGKPEFDFSLIRPQGAPLVTSGGKAPGPEPLRVALERIDAVLKAATVGAQLSPIQCHDILCHLADAVRAGGIRRSAMIALFSYNDDEMLTAKAGNWWEANPQRGRANNSVIFMLDYNNETQFREIWQKVEESGSGEPGLVFTRDLEWGTNPCAEIALQSHQMCNLVEINASTVTSQQDLNERASAAAFLGTLQATYTNFPYLRPVWRETVEREALVGIGATGIASGNFAPYDLEEAMQVALNSNETTARIVGVNPSARLGTVKPSGTTSCILGTSSGIHAWHAPYYIRRIRLGKDEALGKYMVENHPSMVEDDKFDPNTTVVSIPMAAPARATTRGEPAIEMLERVLDVNTRWVRAGHRQGDNYNNVSATVSIRPDEWAAVGEWLWGHRYEFSGMSCLPEDGGTYEQAPFEEIDGYTYLDMVAELDNIDLTQIIEETDETDVSSEAACGPNGCDVVYA